MKFYVTIKARNEFNGRRNSPASVACAEYYSYYEKLKERNEKAHKDFSLNLICYSTKYNSCIAKTTTLTEDRSKADKYFDECSIENVLTKENLYSGLYASRDSNELKNHIEKCAIAWTKMECLDGNEKDKTFWLARDKELKM